MVLCRQRSRIGIPPPAFVPSTPPLQVFEENWPTLPGIPVSNPAPLALAVKEPLKI